jgi:hypothetical protein
VQIDVAVDYWARFRLKRVSLAALYRFAASVYCVSGYGFGKKKETRRVPVVQGSTGLTILFVLYLCARCGRHKYWGAWRRLVRCKDKGLAHAGEAVSGRRRRSIVAPVWSEDEMSSDEDSGLTEEKRKYVSGVRIVPKNQLGVVDQDTRCRHL